MMLTPEQEGLVTQLRSYLEEMNTAPPVVEDGVGVDLFALFGELVALKNEVRIESRQVKGALSQFQALVEPLQSGHAALQNEIERLREDRRTEVRDALRPLLLELLDIRDRMAMALETTTDDKKVKRLFKRSVRNRLTADMDRVKDKRKVKGFLKKMCGKLNGLFGLSREGQEMTLRRLEQTLAARQVLPMDVIGKPLDPRMARAVQVVRYEGVAEGVVVAELRKGFLWGDGLLRLAEVVVNKNGE